MISLYDTNNKKIPIKTFKFPAGEMNVQILDEHTIGLGECTIRADIHSNDDIMTLLLLTDACRRKYGYGCKINLVMRYVPYMQQDRVCNPGESLSIKVFIELINAQKYDQVEIWDPHSDVTSALIDRCVIKEQYRFVDKVRRFIDFNATILVVPDSGALKKSHKVMEKCKFLDMIECVKVRNLRNGSIVDVKIILPPRFEKMPDLYGRSPVLVVDDICVGGRTFIEIAKKLSTVCYGEKYLYVTHGIFSNGFDELSNWYKKIFCPNPWEIDTSIVVPILG